MNDRERKRMVGTSPESLVEWLLSLYLCVSSFLGWNFNLRLLYKFGSVPECLGIKNPDMCNTLGFVFLLFLIFFLCWFCTSGSWIGVGNIMFAICYQTLFFFVSDHLYLMLTALLYQKFLNCAIQEQLVGWRDRCLVKWYWAFLALQRSWAEI